MGLRIWLWLSIQNFIFPERKIVLSWWFGLGWGVRQIPPPPPVDKHVPEQHTAPCAPAGAR